MKTKTKYCIFDRTYIAITKAFHYVSRISHILPVMVGLGLGLKFFRYLAD